MERKASDLFVECLEVEGVKYVFGIPGEETLDLNESLANSSVDFVPVRHEQGGAYMADMYGRLTQRAGVCLGTLGPGATNLVTGIADAFLDRSPLVALTGQGDLERMHKESHQYIDIVSLMKPVTKWNARAERPAHHPRGRPQGVQGRAGPEARPDPHRAARGRDGGEVDAEPLPARTHIRSPEPSAQELLKAVAVIRSAINPVVLAGNGVARVGAAAALREFARATGIGVAETFMGKGLLDYEDPRSLGTVGLQSRDYALAGFEDADVVITVGYDLVEHSPENWNPKKDKKIVCIDTASVEVDEYFMTECDLIGDLYHILTRLAEELRDAPHDAGDSRLNDIILGRFESAKDDDAFPMQPPRALWEIRQALGRDRHADLRRRPAQAVDRAHVPRARAQHRPDRQRPRGHGDRAADRDRRQARPPRPQGGHGQRRRRLPHELPGARDRRAAADPDRQRDLGELAVRLDRLEAGQEVRPPLRHRLHQSRLREAGRRLRDAGLALRGPAARSARSGCSRATTRSRASRTPTS